MKAYLFARKRLLVVVLALSTLAGLGAAYLNRGAGEQISAASTHVLVDVGGPSLLQRRYTLNDFDSTTKRTELLGQVMSSAPVLSKIAREMRLPDGSIGAFSRTTGPVPHALIEPDLEERSAQIAAAHKDYRIEIQPRAQTPVIDIYSQAPTPGEAERLATATITGLRAYLNDLGAEPGVASADSVKLTQLGSPHGTVINSRVLPAIALLSFVVVFGLAAWGLIVLIALRAGRQLARDEEAPHEAWTDDWPHTTRLLPWMLAAFFALLWLLPFNQIQLSFSTPIDLKLDRLVLPFVFGIWIVALATGGRMAPRNRLTGIHLAVAAFVACAFLSVVVDAGWLNHTLEIDQALKRLPLLVAYTSLFFITASSVRPTEVRAYLTFTLALAVICALGIIWEYRAKYNVFYGLSSALLPGIFSVTSTVDATAVDGIGRRLVRGPAAVPLEAVAMLSMSLPIALVWLMQSKTRGRRVLYGLATCLLLAAIMATFRKSAILIPVAVIGTLAYFRRRELLRAAPLALVLVVMIHVVSPGALGSTTEQFRASRLGVATVSDRAVDYDAIRPELWTHLALGRGWGSYDFVNYRVLDSEILQRLIEMGVIGLLLYLLMPISVVYFARRTINLRGERGALALVGAAAAIAFMFASMLFDVLSFPHVTYIFLYMGGLVSVVIGARDAVPVPPEPQESLPAYRPRQTEPPRSQESRRPEPVSV